MSHTTRVEQMLEFLLANQEQFLAKMKAMREARLEDGGLSGKGASPEDSECSAASLSP
jgi:hypothetical protein